MGREHDQFTNFIYLHCYTSPIFSFPWLQNSFILTAIIFLNHPNYNFAYINDKVCTQLLKRYRNKVTYEGEWGFFSFKQNFVNFQYTNYCQGDCICFIHSNIELSCREHDRFTNFIYLHCYTSPIFSFPLTAIRFCTNIRNDFELSKFNFSKKRNFLNTEHLNFSNFKRSKISIFNGSKLYFYVFFFQFCHVTKVATLSSRTK